MGKRELGLILAFIVAGVVVWQATAPKAEGPGFSFGRWLGEARREMRGRSASAEVTTTPAIPIDASINELRLTLSGNVIITGEDRDDVAADLRVVSNGHDEAEARQLATETALKVSNFIDSVVVGWQFPEPGRQQATLRLLVPARLRIQIDGRGTAEITGVESVTLARSAGTIKLLDVAGLIKGESIAGRLTIEGADAVDLSTSGGDTTIGGVRGEVRLTSRSGQVRVTSPGGSVTIRSRDTRVRVEGITRDLRAETVEGDLELNDVGGAIDVDARSTPVTIGWARAAPAKIQARQSSLELILPKDAATYNLDARTTGGELVVPDGLQKTTDGGDIAVTKPGGANAHPIFVRAVGTRITIR
jgi:hypothetical protein